MLIIANELFDHVGVCGGEANQAHGTSCDHPWLQPAHKKSAERKHTARRASRDLTPQDYA